MGIVETYRLFKGPVMAKCNVLFQIMCATQTPASMEEVALLKKAMNTNNGLTSASVLAALLESCVTVSTKR